MAARGQTGDAAFRADWRVPGRRTPARRPDRTCHCRRTGARRGRGTLLPVTVERYGQTATWYFLNDDAGVPPWIASNAVRCPSSTIPWPTTPACALRPNIFVLYEQNIGLLQPIIADELRDAELRYPADWIEDAFRIAVEQNKRAWRYIRAILERWATEGRDAVEEAAQLTHPPR
ncbi:MAG: DnaD domain protein [Anaerolineae bacterium]|nr:MAG: DnaD domain protein [Anaerolineae bacterium]